MIRLYNLFLLPLSMIALCGCQQENFSERQGGNHWENPSPSSQEKYCAWYGDLDETSGVFYFGLSPFWNEFRKSGEDPRADLQREGPMQIGRFDLARKKFLSPIPLLDSGAASGVWDVLVHKNEKVYFTTLYGISGSVDLHSSEIRWFHELGRGLNELAPGPENQILVSRYGRDGSDSGSILLLTEEGEKLREWPLLGQEGFLTAPKTVAYDPTRKLVWVTVDLLPKDNSNPAFQYDARALRLDGRQALRMTDPEIQFVHFSRDGTGFFAERHQGELWLRILPPGEDLPFLPLPGQRILLDADFPSSDFAQDITESRDGTLLITRWSGVVHRFNRNTEKHHREILTRKEPPGLYYTAVVHQQEICATYCRGIEIQCRQISPENESAARPLKSN